MSIPLVVQLHMEHMEVTEKLDKQRQAAQDFFAAYATELRAPHYGDGAKIYAESMLTRAEAAGLYVRPKPEAT